MTVLSSKLICLTSVIYAGSYLISPIDELGYWGLVQDGGGCTPTTFLTITGD